ncbi:MAG TPA: hypothetical protein VFE62_22925 [Gemmataceae bacterium]|nr:hypothetical protein [Gemmataceae bacterium]
MPRCRLFLAFAVALVTSAALKAADPPDDIETRFKKDLSVQTAMARARLLLGDQQAGKAVEVLEEQLRNVNGNPAYLTLLRDAYRAHVRALCLAGQNEAAKRYLDRLCILDPNAANDPLVKPAKDMPPTKFEQEPVKQAALPSWPKFGGFNLFAKKKEEPTRAPMLQTTVRGVSEQAITDDPFDSKHQREDLMGANKAQRARDLLQRGEQEFRSERFAQARVCFEQAFDADANSLEVCKDQWAYCILDAVRVAMDQPGVLPTKLPELQQQVDGAIRMAPTKMMAQGQRMLEELQRRSKQVGQQAPVLTASNAKVRHWNQKNREGWYVVETEHFRIFHRQDTDFGDRVAQIAESTRAAMFKKWFGNDGVAWEPICELIMHPDAGSYTQMTQVPGTSPGHSRIESDPSGRIVARRMDMRMDGAGVLDAVLPHETTHVVLAGMFGNVPVPRWADEGIAVLTEPAEKIAMHRRNLLRHHQEGQLFGLKELMELKDYPHSRRVNAFYAQSVALCDFLTAERGPKTLTDFVRDGVRTGYDAALRRHYNMTFAELETRWTQKVLNGGVAMK